MDLRMINYELQAQERMLVYPFTIWARVRRQNHVIINTKTLSISPKEVLLIIIDLPMQARCRGIGLEHSKRKREQKDQPYNAATLSWSDWTNHTRRVRGRERCCYWATSAGWSSRSRCCCRPRCPPESWACRFYRLSWSPWAASPKCAWREFLWREMAGHTVSELPIKSKIFLLKSSDFGPKTFAVVSAGVTEPKSHEPAAWQTSLTVAQVQKSQSSHQTRTKCCVQNWTDSLWDSAG